jgi:hypothetical protein
MSSATRPTTRESANTVNCMKEPFQKRVAQLNTYCQSDTEWFFSEILLPETELTSTTFVCFEAFDERFVETADEESVSLKPLLGIGSVAHCMNESQNDS